MADELYTVGVKVEADPSGVDRFNQSLRSLQTSIEQTRVDPVSNQLKSLVGYITGLVSIVALARKAWQEFTSAISVTADVQDLSDAFISLGSNVEAAQRQMRGVMDFWRTAKIFDLRDLQNAAMNLQLFGVATENVVPYLQRLATVAAQVRSTPSAMEAAMEQLIRGRLMVRTREMEIIIREIGRQMGDATHVIQKLMEATPEKRLEAVMNAVASFGTKGAAGYRAIEQQQDSYHGKLKALTSTWEQLKMLMAMPVVSALTDSFGELETQLGTGQTRAQDFGETLAKWLRDIDWNGVFGFMTDGLRLFDEMCQNTIKDVEVLGKLTSQFGKGMGQLNYPSRFDFTTGQWTGGGGGGGTTIADLARQQREKLVGGAYPAAMPGLFTGTPFANVMPGVGMGGAEWTPEEIDKTKQNMIALGNEGKNLSETMVQLGADAQVLTDYWNDYTMAMQYSTDAMSREYHQMQAIEKAIKGLGNPMREINKLIVGLSPDRAAAAKWMAWQEATDRALKFSELRMKAGVATMGESLRTGLVRMSQEWGTLQEQAAKSIKAIGDALASDISSGLTDILTGAKSAKQGFRDMALAIIKDIEQIIIKMLVQLAIQKLLGMIPGMSSMLASPVYMVAAPKQRGGRIGMGSGGGDRIPHMLEEGEFVFNRHAAQAAGYQNLEEWNKRYGGGGRTYTDRGVTYAQGGSQPPYGAFWRSGGGTQWHDAIHAAATRHGIDPALMEAIFVQETGWGRSYDWRRYNNPGGIGGPGAGPSRVYASPEEGFEAMASLIARRYGGANANPSRMASRWVGMSRSENASWARSVTSLRRAFGGTQPLSGTTPRLLARPSGVPRLLARPPETTIAPATFGPLAGGYVYGAGYYSPWAANLSRDWRMLPASAYNNYPYYTSATYAGIPSAGAGMPTYGESLMGAQQSFSMLPSSAFGPYNPPTAEYGVPAWTAQYRYNPPTNEDMTPTWSSPTWSMPYENVPTNEAMAPSLDNYYRFENVPTNEAGMPDWTAQYRYNPPTNEEGLPSTEGIDIYRTGGGIGYPEAYGEWGTSFVEGLMSGGAMPQVQGGPTGGGGSVMSAAEAAHRAALAGYAPYGGRPTITAGLLAAQAASNRMGIVERPTPDFYSGAAPYINAQGRMVMGTLARSSMYGWYGAPTPASRTNPMGVGYTFGGDYVGINPHMATDDPTSGLFSAANGDLEGMPGGYGRAAGSAPGRMIAIRNWQIGRAPGHYTRAAQIMAGLYRNINFHAWNPTGGIGYGGFESYPYSAAPMMGILHPNWSMPTEMRTGPHQISYQAGNPYWYSGFGMGVPTSGLPTSTNMTPPGTIGGNLEAMASRWRGSYDTGGVADYYLQMQTGGRVKAGESILTPEQMSQLSPAGNMNVNNTQVNVTVHNNAGGSSTTSSVQGGGMNETDARELARLVAVLVDSRIERQKHVGGGLYVSRSQRGG